MASFEQDRHKNLRICFRLPGAPRAIRESLRVKATREDMKYLTLTLLKPLERELAARNYAWVRDKFPDSPRVRAWYKTQCPDHQEVSMQTVGDFARNVWLQEFVQRGQRASTVLNYEIILHRWIEPCTALMTRPVGELRPADGAMFVNWLGQRHGSVAARNKALRQLARILKRARELGLLDRDPLLGLRPFADDSVELLEQREHELGAWSIEERDRLIEAAEAIAPWQGAAVTVAFFTGMRRGEFFGLQWRDIDFERGEIRIRRSLRPNSLYPATRLAAAFATEQIPAANQHESLPKTVGSRGAIEMLPQVRDALLGQQERLGGAFRMSCPWVFPNERGNGPQQVHNFSNRLWPRIVERAGVPYRAIKQARHTFAVLALQAGFEMVWVQRMLRHSSMQMLVNNYLKYAQAGPASHEAAARLGRLQAVTAGVSYAEFPHPVASKRKK